MCLNMIATQYENKTAGTANLCTPILNCYATFPDAFLTFYASGMILHIHTDPSFISKPKAKNRAGGYFFLSDFP